MNNARVRCIDRTTGKSLRPLSLAVAMACAGWGTAAQAMDVVWFGGTGDWGVAGNWAPASIPGAGDRAIVNAGNASLEAAHVAGALQMSGGAITGAGNLAVSGAASWTGGTIGGFGGSLVSNGSLAISGSANKVLGDFYGTAPSGIVNNAAATWSGSGNLANNTKGVFTNAASGSFDIQTDADFTGGTFNNQGALSKSVGASDGSTVVTALFNNTGRVNVQQGVLEVTTPFNNQGVIDVAAAAQFHGNNAAFSNAGTIQGNGTVQTALNKALSNDGVISPGNGIGIGIGKLTIAGDLKADAAGSLKFELTSLASFDQLALTGDVTLGGDIGVWNLGYTPKLGDSFVVMTFDQRLNTSTFASLTTHGFATGVAFQAVYHDHDVTLDVTSIAPVPEPGTWALMLAGIGVLGVALRRRSLG